MDTSSSSSLLLLLPFFFFPSSSSSSPPPPVYGIVIYIHCPMFNLMMMASKSRNTSLQILKKNVINPCKAVFYYIIGYNTMGMPCLQIVYIKAGVKVSLRSAEVFRDIPRS
jgi:hypothetical protein